MQLIVIEPFLSYKKGDLISDPGIVAAILSTEDARHVAVLGTGGPVIPPAPSATPHLGLPLLTPPQVPSAGVLNSAFTSIDTAFQASISSLTWSLDDTTVFGTFTDAGGTVRPFLAMPAEMTALMNRGGTVVIQNRMTDAHPQAGDFADPNVIHQPLLLLAATAGRIVSFNHTNLTFDPWLAKAGFVKEAWDGNDPYASHTYYELRDLSNFVDVVDLLGPGLVMYVSASAGYDEGVVYLTPMGTVAYHRESPSVGQVLHQQFIPNNSYLLEGAGYWRAVSDAASPAAFTVEVSVFQVGSAAPIGTKTLTYDGTGAPPAVSNDAGWNGLVTTLVPAGQTLGSGPAVLIMGSTRYLQFKLVSGTPSMVSGGTPIYRTNVLGALFTQPNP